MPQWSDKLYVRDFGISKKKKRHSMIEKMLLDQQ